MSPHHINPARLSLPGEDREFSIKHPSAHEYAILEELQVVRREAQAEANLAYEDWRRADTYAVYLAAQDRADAAQDELADYARRLAAAAAATAARNEGGQNPTPSS